MNHFMLKLRPKSESPYNNSIAYSTKTLRPKMPYVLKVHLEAQGFYIRRTPTLLDVHPLCYVVCGLVFLALVTRNPL